MVWDIDKRKMALQMIVSDEKKNSRKGKASTVSNLPASQCSRAIACNGAISVVCANDGRIHVNKGSQKITVLEDPDEWCQAAAFSKDGAMLAVGSHDNNIYVYKAEDWSLIGKCEGHHSYITALDWSEDGKWIRTNSGDYELLFWDAAACK
jgi:WD40 repeat protein